MSKAPAWSFTAMKLFETCPRKYHAEKVEKLYPFEETEQIRYGNEVHKAAEKYVRDDEPLGPHKQFKPLLDTLKAMPGDKHCEEKMALTREKKPTKYFGKDVWLRGASDLTIIHEGTAKVVDYKTGSAKYPDKEQLELMALMTWEYYPDVERVKGALVFMLHDVVPKANYSRSEDYDRLWNKWDGKYELLARAHEEDAWPPKPNGLCRNYCPVLHCEFNGNN